MLKLASLHLPYDIASSGVYLRQYEAGVPYAA
jgi:hypothetical protein